jgi:hypothetical protein
VLPQKGRVHAERYGRAVFDDAFGNLRQDAVRALARVELTTGQTARQQRDDDDRDQNNRLLATQARAALLIDPALLTVGSRRWQRWRRRRLRPWDLLRRPCIGR